MALPTISLDDRSFAQLFGLMRKQIDTAQWDDHNYSDDGMMLVDLLCWIGEMTLYRANRVPQAHYDKFAALILDSPEPVTVPLRLTAKLAATATTGVQMPAGTRFATKFQPDPATGHIRRFIFETIVPLAFPLPAAPLPPDTVQERQVTARELMIVTDETLGTSTGLPSQVYELRPIRTDLNLPVDVPTVVLTDFVHRSPPAYDPNPRVTVGGAAWELKRFLRTDESRVDPAPAPPKQHYMVDTQGRILFGDDAFGSIPSTGAVIKCVRYQILQGADALIDADTLVDQLDPVAGLAVAAMKNGAAEGADSFYPAETRIREGLRRFRRPYRLITAADFERVLRVDFNEYQARARAPERISRAVALMNRRPTAPEVAAPGNVTLIVLAGDPTVDLDAALTDPLLPHVQKEAMVDLGSVLIDKLLRFLDKRRLITTLIHLGSSSPASLPKLTKVSITSTVIVDRDRNTTEMAEVIGQRLRAFLGVTRGGFAGTGWPLGGSVYRSKLFRLIEEIDGVDHVDTLTLSPADANGDVFLDPLSLPAVSALAVTVLRA